MTGRAAGYCAGYAVPGFANRGVGFGRRPFGRGGGFVGGRGWRHRFYATGVPGWMGAGYGPAWGTPAVAPFTEPGKEDQARVLKEQARLLEESLAETKRRLDELEEAPQES